MISQTFRLGQTNWAAKFWGMFVQTISTILAYAHTLTRTYHKYITNMILAVNSLGNSHHTSVVGDQQHPVRHLLKLKRGMNEPLPCCLAFAAFALQQADDNFFFLASQSASLPTLDNRAGGQMGRQAGRRACRGGGVRHC